MIARFWRTFWAVLASGTWIDGADWDKEDGIALASFLSSRTGARLRARLRNSSLSLNAKAVQSGIAHECGAAAGYMLAIADLQSLSATGTLQEPETSETADATGDGSLDHLTP